jgi:hypothetical protein
MALHVNWGDVSPENLEFVKENAFAIGSWCYVLGVSGISDKNLDTIRKRLRLQALLGEVPKFELFEKALGVTINNATTKDSAYLKQVYERI